MPPLLCLSKMCTKDGPSLCMGCQLCWCMQLQILSSFSDGRRHSSSATNLVVTFVAFVLNLAFALSLLCFLVMHASLLSSNTTTIEVNEKKRAVRWKYDLGWRKNFEQVFGTKKVYWFLPLLSMEDLENMPALKGLDFPIRSDGEA
eukprot:TRINITY_DN1781_c0_g2_i11.p2 TRINITY_DN1781_c0_g2~~TRINITY_DN1781_c0_g2_i11.p2  ORF type:complete len:146 (-),score=28.52 TRINITY_DN1781_c0_g2_i11:818-1255(-)